jgi:hypothetical protein
MNTLNNIDSKTISNQIKYFKIKLFIDDCYSKYVDSL